MICLDIAERVASVSTSDVNDTRWQIGRRRGYCSRPDGRRPPPYSPPAPSASTQLISQDGDQPRGRLFCAGPPNVLPNHHTPRLYRVQAPPRSNPPQTGCKLPARGSRSLSVPSSARFVETSPTGWLSNSGLVLSRDELWPRPPTARPSECISWVSSVQSVPVMVVVAAVCSGYWSVQNDDTGSQLRVR